MEKINKGLCLSTVFFALLSLVLAGSAIHLFQKNGDLKEKAKISSESKGAVPMSSGSGEGMKGTVPAASTASGSTGAQAIEAEGTVPEMTRHYEMKVLRFENSDDRIELRLSEEPDMSVVKEYVTVDPAPEGGLSFSFSRRYDYYSRDYRPQLNIVGDFAYRTNLTLRVRKGLPIFGMTSSSNVVVEALQKDYVHTFRRSDERPSVMFADKGRYLPPIGKRALKIESMNVDKVAVKISRVPAGNIVPMFALVEDEYPNIRKSYSYWGQEEEFVGDLATVVATNSISMKNVLNTSENAFVSLDETNKISSNGVFLVALYGIGAKGDGEVIDASAFRVVCVSDLALTVRKTKSKYIVWVTSFTSGKPVKDVEVTLYSKANIPVAKGRTDVGGLCECVKISEDEPFAVVAAKADGTDASFMAISLSSRVHENFASGFRPAYLEENEVSAFAWTERGIYRHGEKIFFHALLRDSVFTAPKPMPVDILLKKPGGDIYLKKTVLSDEYGAVSIEDFVVPDSQPSGNWSIDVRIPGARGAALAFRAVKIEDFAPPQIRTKVHADKSLKPGDFAFEISAEHLYGGPAAGLMCDGAVVFEDAPFAPADWKGWRFGDANRALKPNFRMLNKTTLDGSGKAKIFAPLFKDTGLPAAAIRATVQGTVFEDGGRPATSRDTAILHYYPYYIGTTLKNWVKLPDDGVIEMSVACVAPDGKRFGEPKNLTATLIRIDNVYTYESRGYVSSWKCERVRTTVAGDLKVATKADGDTLFKLPALACGDYELEIADADGEVKYSSTFYASDWGDESVRASLGNPSSVTLTADKNFYRPGDKPKIRVKSPFTGKALLGVFREDLIYTEVVTLTNATTEIELRAVDAKCAPNIDVSLSVVHGVSEKTNHLAARAHGEIALSVRRAENEIEVKVDAKRSGRKLDVALKAPRAATAVVTVVDEGINILTGEKTPDPVAKFSSLREGENYLYDLYNRLLPVADEGELAASGLKTGGDAGAHLLGRVSPVGSRRFKPLSIWKKCVPVKDGKASVSFNLPEFAGEVRVTAVAYSKSAVGATSGQFKITPKLVVQPDAPRFVAPGDEFTITLPMTNRSGKDGDVAYKIYTIFDGKFEKAKPFQTGEIFVKKDCTKTLPFTVTAPDKPGHIKIVFETSGLGENHHHEIELPVRPATAWRATSGVEVLKSGESFKIPKSEGEFSKFTYSVSESPASELKDALEWLADYPYGCLEQTVSRVFPLVTAGGVLNAFSSIEAANRAEYVKAGLRRVESMFVNSHFIIWPDCTYSAADRDLSLYAAHFVVEALKSSEEFKFNSYGSLIGMLRDYARDKSLSVSAYACHTLALAGKPDKGQMYSLYDYRSELDALARARLARAFVLTGDRARASELLSKNVAPTSVKEAAFTLIALLELGGDEKRVNGLVKYLASKRCKSRYSWGTTSDNAHAVLALAEYFRRMPASLGLSDVKETDGVAKNFGAGTAFLSWSRLDLPKLEDVKAESNGLKIEREYFTATGEKYDFARAERGDFVIVRIAVSSDDEREISDLVVEDLLPGAFEGMRSPIVPNVYGWMDSDAHNWVLRHEVRDDRILVFSGKFQMKKNQKFYFHYPVRVVSAGTYAAPGVSVEAMYIPELRARTASAVIEITK